MMKHPPFGFRLARTGPDRLSGALIVGLLAAHPGCGAPDDEAAVDFASEESGLSAALNPYGVGSSVHTTGTIDHTNPFFQQLGTNPRSCATCHAPAQGWTTNSATNTALLFFTRGQDPLFNLVDEGNRPDADVSTFAARIATFKATLAERGLTRFTRTISPTAEFMLTAVDDPYFVPLWLAALGASETVDQARP